MLKGHASIYVNDPETQGSQIKVGSVYPGDGFGELALLNSKPRAATVRCEVESTFAVLKKRDYLRILRKFDERKLNANIDFFKALPLFSHWTRQLVGKLTYYFKEVEFSRNSFVYKQHDQAEAVYFVKKGEFNLIKTLPIRFTEFFGRRAKNQNVHVAILGIGEMLGNEEAVEGRPREHSCQCASSSGSLFRIDRQDFIRRVAFPTNLPSLTYLSLIRQQAHDQRLNSQESKLNSLLRASVAPLQVKLGPVAVVRDRSKPEHSPVSFDFGSYSPQRRPERKPRRTMTNLDRLPDISLTLKPKRVRRKTLQKSRVMNIHMQTHKQQRPSLIGRCKSSAKPSVDLYDMDSLIVTSLDDSY